MQRVLLIFSFALLGAISTLLVIQHASTDASKIQKRIEQNLKELLLQQSADLEEFQDQFTIYSNPFDISSDSRFRKRVYVDGSLVYWSDNSLIADYLAIRNDKSLYYFNSGKDRYVVRKSVIDNSHSLIEIYSLMPLLLDPPIKNQYLYEVLNPEVFDSYDIKLGSGLHQLGVEGLEISATIKNQSLYRFDSWIMWLALIEAVCVLLFLFRKLVRPGASLKQSIGFIGAILASRVVIWLITTYFIKHPLFDPIHFTSSFGYTLGDFLLNSIMLFAVIQLLGKEVRKFLPMINVWISMLVIACLIHGMGYLLYNACWTILDNSLIDLDISHNILFDLNRVVSYLVLVVWALIFFKTFHFSVSWFRKLELDNWKFGLIYLCVFMLSIVLTGNIGPILYSSLAVTFILVLILALKFDFKNLDYKAFLFISLTLASIAWIHSIAIYRHFEKDELVSKKKFANRLLIKNDFLGEYYLNEKISQIGNDSYIRSRLSNQLLAKKNIEEKIKRQYLSSYFDKYDVGVYMFDEKGAAIGQSGRSYASYRADFAKEQFDTDYPNIYFVQDKEDNVQDKYYCFVPITSFDRKVGFIILTFTLKKFIPRSVFPQLMVESQYFFSDDNRFDYAVYRDGKLLYKRGRLEFQNELDYPDLIHQNMFTEGIEKNGVHYYGLKTSDQRTFVIASPTFEPLSFIANFSFLFLILLFSFAAMFAFSRIFDNRIVFNLSTKIQLYLALSFIVPMLIVSVALLNTLNQSYKEEIDKNFSKQSYNISEYLIEAMERFNTNEINRDEFGNAVSQIASLLQSDINLYSPEGRLLASSEVEIFNIGLLSKQLAPAPYNAIKYGNAESKIYKQSIGDLDFRVSYVGLRSYKDGRLMGILSLPYFDSKNHLQRQQEEVFNNLVSIFTMIFLLSIVLGNLAIERLIRPLKLITARLKMTDLKEVNEPIEYESADEIGTLIQEYNQMILKLEESKAALAESQKESAWKEIARQVAHEIKNPLTPMRLKIQQLMRQKESGTPEYITLNSLIVQIDVLSSIADSFSAFARMPAPRNERFNLTQLLRGVIDIHCSEIEIDCEEVTEAAFVNTDPKIFSGIFNNIILNAMQSISREHPKITVSLEKKPKKVIVSIRDNGEGIDEANREKIFTPYFSTKTTGSGIGLAVAKKGIENAGGTIWFESTLGEGTTFFISMPIVP